MNKTELAYIAGFFDGEGSISIHGKHHNVRVGLSNTNPLIPQLVCKLFGGSVNINKSRSSKQFKVRPLNHRLCLQWCLNGQKACKFLSKILPYLKMKNKQAILAMELQRTKRVTLGGTIVPLSRALIVWRERQKMKITNLNKEILI